MSGGEDKSDVIAVVLGAARFPRWPAIDNERLGDAFLTSKKDVARILWTFASDVLDRFDSALSPNGLCEEIADFLHGHSSATDLIVYYVGHGGFLEDQAYFLALRETATDREHATALRAADLATTLKSSFRQGRTFLVLDCCFAGSVVSSLQGPIEELMEQQVAKGVALLNAASKDKAAIVPPGASRTMFSDCLCDVLSAGIPGAHARLSLRDIRASVVRRIGEKYPSETKAWPEVHAPRQFGGQDVADFPLFPNAGRGEAASHPPPVTASHSEPIPAPESSSLPPAATTSTVRPRPPTGSLPSLWRRRGLVVFASTAFAAAAGVAVLTLITRPPRVEPMTLSPGSSSIPGAIAPPPPTPMEPHATTARELPLPPPASPTPKTKPGPKNPGTHEQRPAATLCVADPFTGGLRPARADPPAGGERRDPCRQDSLTGHWMRVNE